jgi:integrase/recombinase XerD
MHWTDVLGDWQLWMRAANLSARTIEDRAAIVDLFARRQQADPITAELAGLLAFLAGLPSSGTRYTYYVALKAWFRFLVMMDVRADDPMVKVPRPKAPRGMPRPVSPQSVHDCLAIVNRRRTRAMFVLAVAAGLRVHEIAKVRGEDVDDALLHVAGKGGRRRSIPVHPMLAAEAARMPRRGLWFPSYQDSSRPVTPGNVSKVLGGLMSRAGVAGTPHALRHFFATEALRSSGGNLRVVQHLLGHASVAGRRDASAAHSVDLSRALAGSGVSAF